MRIGLLTDSLSALSLEEVASAAEALGVTDLEFCTGGWSQAPHLDLRRMLADRQHRERFTQLLAAHGLRISALNANGNQLHPRSGAAHDATVRDTVELAALLEVPTVVLMSGLPGGAAGDATPNWITSSWPPETQDILDYQWNEVALPYWADLATLGARRGVRFAVEMHGQQLVYNPSTLLRLRSAIGDIVGANVDPSHLMWQGADPRLAVRALTGAIHHVHAKDARLQHQSVGVDGVLGTQPPEEHESRPWNYVTLGHGQLGGQQFWAQLFSDLRAAGYEGVLSIEHEDVLVDAGEGVAQAVALLRAVAPTKQPSWKPADV